MRPCEPRFDQAIAKKNGLRSENEGHLRSHLQIGAIINRMIAAHSLQIRQIPNQQLSLELGQRHRLMRFNSNLHLAAWAHMNKIS